MNTSKISLKANEVAVRAWKAYLFENDQLSDETLINENSEELAWEIFKENHNHFSSDAYVTLEETVEVIDYDSLTDNDEILYGACTECRGLLPVNEWAKYFPL